MPLLALRVPRRTPGTLPTRSLPPTPALKLAARIHSRTTHAQTVQHVDMGAPQTGRVRTGERLAKLREEMGKFGVQAYYVPSEDEHASEYVAASDERRVYISGFNGSAGAALVTADAARLWTDGRYHLQASQQLDDNWTLMKQGLADVPTWTEYLKTLPPPFKIGVDPRLLSASEMADLTSSLPAGLELVPLKENLVDLVWEKDGRPARTARVVVVQPEEYAGLGAEEKIRRLREEVEKRGGGAFVASMLDEVAWLFNLRGSDVDYNPVFFAYALITLTSAHIFINPSQLSSSASEALARADVQVRPYEEVFDALRAEGETGKKVLLGKRASLALTQAVGEGRYELVRSPVVDAKSIKSPAEIAGTRAAHVRDGASLVQYFAWLGEELRAGREVSEYEAAGRLEEYRRGNDKFKGLSFTTISSTGPNGAIIHYSPSPTTSAKIDVNAIYLCDSGAQYLDGTTDVTRTWHFGLAGPSAEEKRAFTRVLQGHIAIDTAVIPNGTTGYSIDAFARRPLWQDGLDYLHGTGHGVGAFLNVHEGPHGIGKREAFNETPLKEGMIVSNEPGFYKDAAFGIRIENLLVVRKADTPNNFNSTGYLSFEHLTLCPIQTLLVDAHLLSPAEREWLNAYHQEVREKLTPLLKERGDERALGWLERETEAI